jgi:hypothetical protein
MVTPKKKRPQAAGESDLNGPRGRVVRIRYAEDETGPAELLGEGLARIIDVPLLTDRFWRDDVVRLRQDPDGGLPRVAGVAFTRFERRSMVQFFGGEGAGALLLSLFSLLGFDSAVIVLPADERPGWISVAHAAGFRPAAVVKLIGADKPECMPPGGNARSGEGQPTT